MEKNYVIESTDVAARHYKILKIATIALFVIGLLVKCFGDFGAVSTTTLCILVFLSLIVAVKFFKKDDSSDSLLNLILLLGDSMCVLTFVLLLGKTLLA